MRFRKLRIAWSVSWGVVAVLLCVLWARSYWRTDSVSGPINTKWTFGASIVPGGYVLFFAEVVSVWNTDTESSEEWLDHSPPNWSRVWGDLRCENNTLCVPCWCSVAATVGMAAMPWFAWLRRFSLRTLLIAVTPVAVGLGLIVWASHR
jgi:hypothetical protein